MAQIVLFENIHPSARAAFEAAGYTDIVTHAAALPLPSVRRPEGRAGGGHPFSHPPDAGLLSDNPDLRVVGCFCIGTNQVDLDTAMQRGIQRPSTPARSPSWYWRGHPAVAPHS